MLFLLCQVFLHLLILKSDESTILSNQLCQVIFWSCLNLFLISLKKIVKRLLLALFLTTLFLF